jgi:hypothetical protein
MTVDTVATLAANNFGPSINGSLKVSRNGIGLCRNGLTLSRRMQFREWERIGQYVLSAHESSAWWIGDWIAYGQDIFHDRYKEALNRTSLDYQTLRNYAWVARQFELSRRRDNLSFGHHAEVAALPQAEQDYWLSQAQSNEWSRNRLRAEVKHSLAERADGQDQPTPAADEDEDEDEEFSDEAAGTISMVIELRVRGDQVSRFRQAADRESKSLEEWAVVALETASTTARGRRFRGSRH